MGAKTFDFTKDQYDTAGEPVNLAVEQGADFNHVLTWKDSDGNAINLTGYSARMKIKPHVDSSTTLDEWTSGGGELSLGGSAGTITFVVTAATTAAYDPATWGQYAVYDLEVVSGGGIVTRLIEGRIELSPEVTD